MSKKKRFSRIYVEITNRCNLSCSFCVGNTRPLGTMTAEEFDRVLTAIAPYTDYVYLHVLGEPLLHPQLEQLLALCHRHGLHANITTNGTLLAQVGDMLCTSPGLRKVGISIHSLEGATPQATDQYLSTVAQFAQKASTAGKLCELRFWNLGVGDVENEAVFHTLCSHLDLTDSEVEELSQHLCQTGNVTLRPNLFLGKAERFDWPALTAPETGHAIYCHGLGSQMAVLCDGTVVPCCLDSKGDINLGNVFYQSLSDILATPRAIALHEGFGQRTPSEPLCQRCGYATRF